MKKEMKTLLLVGSLSAGIFCGHAVYAADQTVPTTISTTPAVKRVIGIKAAEAESVYFTNKMGADVKGIYIKCSDQKDWGKNLVPSESFVHDTEQVQIYYNLKLMSGNSDTHQIDLKILTKDNSVYEFCNIDSADMKDKAFLIEKEDSTFKLKYTSLSEQSEKEVKEYIPSTSLPETSSEEDYAENNPYDYDIDSSYEGDNYDPDNSVSADEEYQENGDDESTSDEDSNYQPEPYYGEVIKDKTYTNSNDYYQDVDNYNSDNYTSDDEDYQGAGDDESASDEDSNYQPEPYYGEVIKGKTYTNSDEYYQDVKAFNYVDLFPSVKMDFS